MKGQRPIKDPCMPVKIIATKLSDSSKGTGFIVHKDNAYYLVTAKHIFFTMSVQRDYTMPEYENSLQNCAVLDPNGNVIQELALTNEKQKTILYKTFDTDKKHALDIAVLPINKPVTFLKTNAISFKSLSQSLIPYYSRQVSVRGFPSRTKTFSDFQSVVAPKDTQDLLDKDGKYFFIIETETDLKGISGAPVFLPLEKNGRVLAGIFVGENHNHGELGYAIFAFYIAEIIRNYK
jgi:hypothetical protein